MILFHDFLLIKIHNMQRAIAEYFRGETTIRFSINLKSPSEKKKINAPFKD